MVMKCEVNGVEIKSGQYWRTRSGEIVNVFGVCPVESPYPVMSVNADGHIYSHLETGNFYRESPNHYNNLITHLPDCTGFDWVEKLPDDYQTRNGKVIDPGEGYRMLQYGEEIDRGDEYFNRSGKWWMSFMAGKTHQSGLLQIRRKIAVPEPATPTVTPEAPSEYRILDKSELIQEGDECRLGTGPWLLAWNWRATGKQGRCEYRRKITQEPAPYIPEFWYGQHWVANADYAYAVRREQGGPIVYVRLNGTDFPAKLDPVNEPHSTWISITETEAMHRLNASPMDPDEDDDYWDEDEDDDYDDDDYDDDDYDDSGTDDDTCGWTSNFSPSDYDDSGDDDTVHVHLTVNIYVSSDSRLISPIGPESPAEPEVAAEPVYRALELDEVIERGDELYSVLSDWTAFHDSVGKKLRDSGFSDRETRTTRPATVKEWPKYYVPSDKIVFQGWNYIRRSDAVCARNFDASKPDGIKFNWSSCHDEMVTKGYYIPVSEDDALKTVQ